jgi:mono/diheme cytochrome c family protein
MKGIRSHFALALLSTLLAAAVLVIAGQASSAVSFIYRSSGAIIAAHQVVLIAGYAAAGALCLIALWLFIPLALRPAGWWRRVLHTLPLFALGIALVGVALTLAGIGSGAFAGGWLAAGGLLTALALAISATRVSLSPRAARLALAGVGVTLVGWGGLLALAAMVLSTPAAAFSGAGGFSGAPGGDRPPEGGGAPGGFGEGGGLIGSQSLQPLLIGSVVVLTLLAVAMVVLTLRGWRSLRSQPEIAEVQPVGQGGWRDAASAAAALAALAVAFLAVIQLVPVSRTNPPVQTTVQWDSQQTRDLATRACMDCHSNETRWPWYATIAPGSWLTTLHVNEGRQRLNLSELNSGEASRAAEESVRQIQNGSMPLKDYLLIHADANLTDAEKQQLIQGLQASLSN